MKAVFLEWWNERQPREKLLLGVGGAVLVLAVLYSVLLAPAQQGRSELRDTLPAMQRQLAKMEAQADEAKSLSSVAAGAVPTGNALKTALTAALGDHGLKSDEMTVAGSAVRIGMKNVSFAAWTDWLDDVRRRFKVQLAEGNITGLATAGQVDLTATLEPAASDK
ncbi:MAG: type II secretion system protein GspM [Janthinobacterium lividum]